VKRKSRSGDDRAIGGSGGGMVAEEFLAKLENMEIVGDASISVSSL
jgi:hypothetical protein